MSRWLAATVLSLVCAGAMGVEAEAIRNKPPATSDTASGESASDHLNSGMDRLSAAERLERTDPRKARKEYQAALKELQRAVALSTDNYRAHNALGYAYRKLGDFRRALESYDRALALAPGFPDAIEYRAEAYLGLNRLDEAKQAYMHLFVHDRTNANMLMRAMKAWVQDREADPKSIEPSTVATFAAWVRERDMLAASTINLGHNSPDWK